MTDQNDARARVAQEISRVAGCQVGSERTRRLVDYVLTYADERAATARGEADELRRENERLSKAIMGGILPGLLNEDETDALVDLVKSLRSPARAR